MHFQLASSHEPIPTQAPMTDLFFIAVVLASFAATWGFMRLLGRL
ncbi:hypothetical protein OV203_12680 [Nannocystis sp. ILAH1]|nr:MULTISPECIES: hypothetical protein [unclassified Nannocystis]MCY0987984.1 hypothetical protein [Nannocystis sp. ILAH1]MCY1065673.1 hypothetical protein [Nannocystis sp. RBIL2]